MKNLLFLFSFILGVCFGESVDSKKLLDNLYVEDGWVVNNILDDGTKFYTKKIETLNQIAVKVSQVTNIIPKYIKSVVTDLDKYGEFLSNSNTMSSTILFLAEEYVDGYQHIRVSLPFFSDRRYCFRMFDYDLPLDSSGAFVEWFLLDENLEYTNFLKQNNPEAIYISIGSGSWSAKVIDTSRYDISYRLIMDPGGAIPDFLTQKINSISIINLFRDVMLEAKRRASF